MYFHNSMKYLEESVFPSYVAGCSARQLVRLREIYGLPFEYVNDELTGKLRRVYPLRKVNEWILKNCAHLYDCESPIEFVNSRQAGMIGKDSYWSLAHQRIRGQGLPFFRVGYKVIYIKLDVLK